jgi:Na+-transporting NADH:ubiquinone oxidoreductase subunit NqrB
MVDKSSDVKFSIELFKIGFATGLIFGFVYQIFLMTIASDIRLAFAWLEVVIGVMFNVGIAKGYVKDEDPKYHYVSALIGSFAGSGIPIIIYEIATKL